MKRKIVDKNKFITRILELIILGLTTILTPLAINYANIFRGYKAFGGEYLVPIFGLLIILVIETIYEEAENKNGGKK